MIPIKTKDPTGIEIVIQTNTLFESEHFGIIEEGQTKLLYIYSKNGQRITPIGTIERGRGIIQRLEANQNFLNGLEKGIVDKMIIDKAALETYNEIKEKYAIRFRIGEEE